jgi:hypothetical protein
MKMIAENDFLRKEDPSISSGFENKTLCYFGYVILSKDLSGISARRSWLGNVLHVIVIYVCPRERRADEYLKAKDLSARSSGGSTERYYTTIR